jgi:uncharacterized membrane protein
MAKNKTTKIDSRLLSALAYVLTILTGIIVLVIALSNKDKKAAFHGVQAILFGISIWIIFYIISLFFWIIPFIGWAIINLIAILFFLAGLYLAYLTYIEKSFTLPIITELSNKISNDLIK